MTAASPLAWPDGWPCTPLERRERGYQFKKLGDKGWRDKFISFAEARDGLYDEMRRLGAKLPVVSTNHPTALASPPNRSGGSPTRACPSTSRLASGRW